MAFDTLILENPRTGQIREAPLGFSWTVFFFSFFPPAIRGNWKYFFIMLLASLCSFGLSGWVFCFIYNKLYIRDLLNDGYFLKSSQRTSLEIVSAKVGRTIPLAPNSTLATPANNPNPAVGVSQA